MESVISRTGLAVNLDADESIDRFDRELETVCFRVIQEALTNAIRHGNARQVQIKLSREAGRLEVRLVDDGRGFDLDTAMERAATGASLGLLGMRERVSLVGGELSITSAPGAGTEIKASFPIKVRSATRSLSTSFVHETNPTSLADRCGCVSAVAV